MGERTIRVLLADDEIHIRQVLRGVVKAEGFELVAEANNGEDAVALFRKHRPDLTLLDVNLPLMTGDEALAEIVKEAPEARVVMLTMVSDAGTVRRCLELGASGYILKSNDLATIRTMVREAVAGLPGKG